MAPGQGILQVGIVPEQAHYAPACAYCFRPIARRICRILIPPASERVVCSACYRLYATLTRMIFDRLFTVAPPEMP